MSINLDCAPLTHACATVVKTIRPNILILATFVFAIVLALVFALFRLINNGDAASNETGEAVSNSGNQEFLKGALIGLIGTGITALTALGNNILEKDDPKKTES